MSYQTQLPIPLPAVARLLPVSMCMVSANQNEDFILRLVEEGVLQWAWDIAGKNAIRRVLRIYSPDFAGWTEDEKAWLSRAADNRSAEEIVQSLLPHSRPELRGTELQRVFCCGHSHIINLIKDGLLTATTEIKTGPNGSPKITVASIVQLLLSRRVL